MAAIERFAALDPQSPDTLGSRLDYATFLAKAAGGDCGSRLDRAQSQLEQALASPATGILLPAASARTTHVEYLIHLARAECGDRAARERELRAALDAARRAVGLYAEAFDGASRVTMQFNVSAVYRRLGESDAAAAALQATLDLDREYGLRDDAEENTALLLQWNHQPAGAEQVAALLRDFPQRSTTLRFHWAGGVTQGSFASDYARLLDGRVLEVRGTRSVRRQVRRHPFSWSVSMASGPAQGALDPGSLDAAALQSLLNSLAGMLVPLHGLDVDYRGDFFAAIDDRGFTAQVTAEAAPLAAASAPQAGQALKSALAPASIDGAVAVDYELQTGTWIGATLRQGVWYGMAMALPLPYAPQLLAQQRIEFAYTRSLPCVAGAAQPDCVELVLHATPEPTDPQRLAAVLHMPGVDLRTWGATLLRLVVDPDTLLPYLRDLRRYTYVSAEPGNPGRALIESQRTLLLYGRPQPAAP